MICYSDSINGVEILVVNDYWEIAEGTTDSFLRTAKSIYEKYKSQKIRPVHQIIKGSLFLPESINFQCRECGEKMPVSTRTDYKSRLKLEIAPSCTNCVQEEVIRRLNEAQLLVDEYNQKTFSQKEYINLLTLAEMLAFLSLITDKPIENDNLREPPKSISVTGIESIDHNLFNSLKSKGAIIDARSMPDDILSAKRFISNTFHDMQAGYYPRLSNADFYARVIWPEVYFRKPVVDGEVIERNISDAILKSIQKKKVSHRDIEDITHIVTEIQTQKLHKSIDQIRKEFEIYIEESGFIGSILYYFSKNHSPIATHFSLRHIAKEAVVMLHTRKVPRDAEKHVFAKLLSNYSRNVEKHKWSLDYTKPLPVSCQTSRFEAMFSIQYCGEINFDTLSTREVIKRWLDSVGESSVLTDRFAWDRMFFDSSTS